MDVQVRYQNGTLTISLGGQSTAGFASGGTPGSSPPGGTPGSSPPGGSTSGGGSGCCGGLVLGPIVIPMAGYGSVSGGTPGTSPPGGTPGTSPPGGTPGTSPPGGGTASQSIGCCCPTVIGPIVFTDCCSSTASESAGPPSIIDIDSVLSQAPLHIVPPTGLFEMQTQQEIEWCWSAVTVSVNNFLDTPDVWTQTKLASKVLRKTCSLAPSFNDPCNQEFALDISLTAIGNLQPDGAFFDAIVAFKDLETYWNKLPIPICARIVWDDGSGNAHFIALGGYTLGANGEQNVLVYDPAPGGYGGPTTWDYDLLKSSYQCPPDPQNPLTVMPSGHWNDSYFVQP